MSSRSSSQRGTAQQIKTLETDLKKVREASEALIAERDDLKRRLEAAETKEGLEPGETLAALFDQLQLKQPRQRTVEAYTETLRKLLNAGSASASELVKAESQLRANLERIQALETALAEARAAVRPLPSDEETISRLIEENRLIARQMEEAAGDLNQFRKLAEEAKTAVEAARQETDSKVRAELGQAIARLNKERDGLNEQIVLLSRQLTTQGKTPLLPANQVAVLLNGLMGELRGGLNGVAIRDGEIKLKVGFGVVDDKPGFVIPTPDSGADLQDKLHEVTFRFDTPASLIIRRSE
ncbi:MAG: hypothetical protein JNM70_20375 [Anaerolineae bacterium]|nr:hypothetical protein [Anaerolineae bacterium]